VLHLESPKGLSPTGIGPGLLVMQLSLVGLGVAVSALDGSKARRSRGYQPTVPLRFDRLFAAESEAPAGWPGSCKTNPT
jgi:hypothetical protein